MKKKSLVYSAEENTFAKEISILEKPGEMRILSNPIAWKIINLLSDKPMYPAQIAKELKIYEQSAYYYIHRLVSIGVVEEVGTNLVRGGTARLYRSLSPSFGIEMNWGEKHMDYLVGVSVIKKYPYARKFFSDYIINNSFHGLIVVGA